MMILTRDELMERLNFSNKQLNNFVWAMGDFKGLRREIIAGEEIFMFEYKMWADIEKTLKSLGIME